MKIRRILLFHLVYFLDYLINHIPNLLSFHWTNLEDTQRLGLLVNHSFLFEAYFQFQTFLYKSQQDFTRKRWRDRCCGFYSFELPAPRGTRGQRNHGNMDLEMMYKSLRTAASLTRKLTINWQNEVSVCLEVELNKNEQVWK